MRNAIERLVNEYIEDLKDMSLAARPDSDGAFMYGSCTAEIVTIESVISDLNEILDNN